MTQVGTPLYISPEIWNNKAYDYKTDIWSIGCLLYEMCTLNYPFLGRNMDELRRNVLRGRFGPIPTFYGEDLTTIIKTCLQVTPSQRPNIDGLLNNNIIIAKSKEFQQINVADLGKKECMELLATIKVPLNLNMLKNKLPSKRSNLRRSNSVGMQRPQSANNSRQLGIFSLILKN